MNHIVDATKMIETITGVAIISRDGAMIALPAPNRHHHLIALTAFVKADMNYMRQGFVTNAGRFVDRIEGLEIAHAAKQVDRANKRELFSEDLW